jgi:F-type H+-transporting ATPase subunit b
VERAKGSGGSVPRSEVFEGRYSPGSKRGLVLPNLSVFWVIFFVLLLTIILDRLLLKPILRVMAERETAIRSARELAERSASEARTATAEFEQKTAAARADLYRQMDDMRRKANDERAETLARARAEAEAQVAAASATLKADADEARRKLSAEAAALGDAVAERILGRRAS